ncbi:MAG: hypothetical protein JWQ69_5389, partial [Pseudomonas sp.]|nr:hypothetical protein [Pseudomonas sp.]
MRFSSTSLLASLLLLTSILTGCAAVVQKPIPLDQTFWSAKEQTIGVAITKLPPPELVLTGTQGLLDVLVNKGVNSSLSQQVSQWELKDFDSLPDEIVAKLVAKGYKAKRVPGSLDMAAY